MTLPRASLVIIISSSGGSTQSLSSQPKLEQPRRKSSPTITYTPTCYQTLPHYTLATVTTITTLATLDS